MSSNPYNDWGRSPTPFGSKTYNKADVKAGRVNPYDAFGSDTKDTAAKEQKSLQDSQAKSRAKQVADQVVKQQTGSKNPAQTSSNPNNGLPDWVNAAGKIAGDINKKVYGSVDNYVGDNVVKPTIQHLKTGGEVIDAATGASDQKRQLIDARARFLNEDLKSNKITQTQFDQGMKKVGESYAGLSSDIKNSDFMKKDRTQIAAETAAIPLDIGVPGIGGKVIGRAAETAANAAGKTGLSLTKDTVAKKLIRTIGKAKEDVVGGGAYAGAYGAQQQAEQKGNAVTPVDIATGVAKNAPVGAALGIGLPILGKGLGKLADRGSAPIKLPTGISHPDDIIEPPTPATEPVKIDQKAQAAEQKLQADTAKPKPTGTITTYSGHQGKGSPFSTTDKQFATDYANEDANGNVVKGVVETKKLDKADILDTRHPGDRAKLESVLGKDNVQKMIDASGNGLPNHVDKGEQDALIKAADQLGYKHIALSETDAATKYNGKDVISYADTPRAKVGTQIQPLKSLSETPNQGVSKLATSVRDEAVHNKLITKTEAEIADLPTYNKANLKEQAQYATDLINKDPQQAIDIALGKTEPPAHIIPQMVFNAVEEHAKSLGGKEGGQLIKDLAMSRRVTDLSTMGQNIRAAGERDPHSAVNMVNEVALARSQAAQKRLRGKTLAGVAAADRKIIKDATPKVSKYDWDTFVSSLQC